MIATQPSTAADVIAAAVMEISGQSSGHRRLYLRTHLGVAPAQVFGALERWIDEEVRVGAGEGRLIGAVRTGNTLLVPYLVDNSTMGGNRGVQGYAGTLRTDFTAHAGNGERRVLLVLDERPFETVISAAEDAGELGPLSWNSLLRRVAAAATGAAATLVRDVAADLQKVPWTARSATLLNDFASFAASEWADLPEAGRALPALQLYVQDPYPSPARLEQSRQWRTDLQAWTLPDKDMGLELNRRGGELTFGIQKVLAARGVSGLDWQAFTLDDLPARKDRARAALVRPPSLVGLTSYLSSGDTAAGQLAPNDETIGLRFRGNSASLAPYVRWGTGLRQRCHVDEAAMLISVPVPRGAASPWLFGRVELRRGESLELAIIRSTATWFPADASLLLDTEAGAFIATQPAQILAVGGSNTVIGNAACDIDDSDPSQVVIAQAAFGAGVQPIPLLVQDVTQTPDDGDPDDSPGGDGPQDPDDADPDDTSPDDDPDDADPDDGDIPPTELKAQESGLHALLTLASARAADGMLLPESTLSFSGGEQPAFSGGGVRYPLVSQQLGDLDGLQLERDVLAQPATMAFSVSRDTENPGLRADPTLQRLSLDSLDADLLAGFLTARASFFAALTRAGSVHALLCGLAVPEAQGYVRAYLDLLHSIPVPGSYEAEYDRLLLCDLVSDPATGRCWLAPTNPVTVAWALQAAGIAANWVQQGTQLPSRDIAAVRPTYLLPLVHAGNAWWETDPRSPLLWRGYRQLGSSVALGSSGDQTITRRLEKFLRVFPQYADPRQRLAIALYEPGDGGSAAKALRRFYAQENRPEAEACRPQLDITVYCDDGQPPEALTRLVAPHNDADIDRLVRSRITLRTVASDEEKDFAHLSFVFRAPAAREPRDVQLTDRCPTDWVDGLATAPGRLSRIGANTMTFASGLFVSPSPDVLTSLLNRTLELVGGQPNKYLHEGHTQTTTTTISTHSLAPIYSSSVWTTHADRLLGPETFSPANKRPLTIVDFDDRSGYWRSGMDSITVTERVDPYRTALARAFIPAATLHEDGLQGLINLGNAVSGRWNLDLLSQPVNGVRERLGILAAIAAIRDLDEAFAPARTDDGDLGGVLLPLAELFALLPASGQRRPSSRACDDLLYLRVLRHTDGNIHLRGRLLEVKYASAGQPDLNIARRELTVTRDWLDGVFNVRTPAHRFRSRDLAEFVRASVARNHSFGLEGLSLSDAEATASAIAAGRFRLDFTYQCGDSELAGDVISLELESPVPARRQSLPGEGPAMGYIRLGGPTLQQLARHANLTRPSAWQPVSFPADPVPAKADVAPATRPDPAQAPAPSSTPSTAPQTPQDSGGPTNPVKEKPAGRTAPVPSAATTARKSAEVATKAAELDDAATKYGLHLAPIQTELAQIGPSVIRFRTRLLGKQTLAGVRSKALDLGREIGIADGLLVDQEPYYVTLDVPRTERVVVPLADYLPELARQSNPGALSFLLGMAPSGDVRVEDLARLPHLLVAGATGSGKSVLLRGLLCCLAAIRTPDQLQILLVDPKGVDFEPFEQLPHLVDNRIVTDPGDAIKMLGDTLAREVAWRRETLKTSGATSALEFYEKGGTLEQLPQMVILVDEFADLAASLDRTARQAFMQLIQRFGQLTRAFGIYLVLATQRPSVQVITGDIKANLTARVALKVQSAIDSTTILGRGGAEALRDQGDLLFDHGGKTERLQGFYTSPEDVRNVLSAGAKS
ncbi:FtsK/SpoIIIE domain-containing protein [Catenuloplanes sp. NPDC051500]|uniref:FtsK/SpoIIIE domain-containing protein n=1 Tax=Catenuloplanes sp. NPDC051500 TaxID=3363959 RepID=UPI0037AC79DD